MNWKLLICSVFLTEVLFLTLMFYLGFDLDTFKKSRFSTKYISCCNFNIRLYGKEE